MNNINIQKLPQNVARGATLIVVAMFVTSVQDVVFKLFSNELTLWQIFSLRALLALPLLITLTWVQGIQDGVVAGALQKWPLLRSLFITLTFIAFYAAIPFLSLSTVGAANYIAPIFVTLLTAFVIKESIGLSGWAAVFIGFTGVVLLLQPNSDSFSLWVLLPIIGAFFYALSHIITRTKCQSVPTATMALSLNLVMLAAGLIVSGIMFFLPLSEELIHTYPYLYSNWSHVGISEWFTLGLLAILSIVIGLGIVRAYQAASPSTVATFEYSYLVFVAIWDHLFFSTLASGTTILGILLIIGAGLMVLRR